MKLYNYYRSSASFRVRIALHWKNIKFEYVPIHLLNNGGEQFSEEYRAMNPMCSVPTLVHGEHAITESMAILQYLDDIESEPRLFPQEPLAKARVFELCEIVNAGIQPLQNLRVQRFLENDWKIPKDQSMEFIHHWMKKGLAALEQTLAKTSDVYSLGRTFTAADCFVIPQCFTARRFNVELGAYPNLMRVFENGSKLPAVVRAQPDKQPDFPPQ